MDEDMIATHLGNLDRRLAQVEQILPTLATKADLPTLATKADLLTLATKADLLTLATKEQLAEAIAPLATQVGLDELRRHMNILHEDLRSDIRLLAEHVASDRPKHGNG